MTELLFEPGTTHVVVTCWRCKRDQTFYPQDLPDGIDYWAFCGRAVCKGCAAHHPHVTRYPKPLDPWQRSRPSD